MERQGFDPMQNNATVVMEFMERCEATEDFDAASQKPKAKSKKKTPTKNDEEKDETKVEKKYKYKNGNGKYKNKTWNRKAEEGEKKAKNDLAAFIKKEISKGVKKSLEGQKSKKRKAIESDSDDDLKAFDPKDFNYEDMANLKIDSDDEVSI